MIEEAAGAEAVVNPGDARERCEQSQWSNAGRHTFIKDRLYFRRIRRRNRFDAGRTELR